MKLAGEQCHRYGRMIEDVEKWLQANFPDSLLGFADRFFTRSLRANSDAAQADLARLREACDLLIEVCQVQADADELRYDVTAVRRSGLVGGDPLPLRTTLILTSGLRRRRAELLDIRHHIPGCMP